MSTQPVTDHYDRLDLGEVVIMPTRYGGVYEGGAWAAFAFVHTEERPGQDLWLMDEGVFGGDPDCMAWWENHRHEVGVGDTPTEAWEDLCRKRPQPEG